MKRCCAVRSRKRAIVEVDHATRRMSEDLLRQNPNIDDADNPVARRIEKSPEIGIDGHDRHAVRSRLRGERVAPWETCDHLQSGLEQSTETIIPDRRIADQRNSRGRPNVTRQYPTRVSPRFARGDRTSRLRPWLKATFPGPKNRLGVGEGRRRWKLRSRPPESSPTTRPPAQPSIHNCRASNLMHSHRNPQPMNSQSHQGRAEASSAQIASASLNRDSRDL